jgi:hypothetical protein
MLENWQIYYEFSQACRIPETGASLALLQLPKRSVHSKIIHAIFRFLVVSDDIFLRYSQVAQTCFLHLCSDNN